MAGELKISVQSDLRQAVARLESDVGAQLGAAAARALNRSAVTTRAEAARKIRERYNLKVGTAKAQMRIDRASRNRLTAQVIVSGRPIPLFEFSARAGAAGVSVEILRGKRRTLKGRFLARMKSGHQGVYERKGKPRLPIRELFTVGLPAMFTQRTVLTAIEKVALERFRVELDRELKFRTRG